MKKLLLVILTILFFVGCSVKEEEAEVSIFRDTFPVIYTGRVSKKVPNGKGTATFNETSRVEGQFENGTFVSGTATNIPYAIAYREETINGMYTGEVAEELPSGTGTFESDAYSFTGVWVNGESSGQGLAKIVHYQLDTPSGSLEGQYDGHLYNGLAEGPGTFTYANDTEKIQIIGQFVNNTFDGQAIKTIQYKETTKSYPVVYQQGTPVNNPATIIAYLEGMRKDSYCLTDAQFSFLLQNATLFEGKQTTTDFDSTYQYQTFLETNSPSFILLQNAFIKSIQRYRPYEGADTVTSMIVQNNDGWYHVVFAYSVDNVSMNEYVDIVACPLCHSTLTAVEEDYPALDVAGAYIVRK